MSHDFKYLDALKLFGKTEKQYIADSEALFKFLLPHQLPIS